MPMDLVTTVTITAEEFIEAAREFVKVSNKIWDGWKLHEDKVDIHKSYLKKATFIDHDDEDRTCLVKAEYVIFYHLSYGVPAFSFNAWKSSGVLLSLEDLRRISFNKINREDFYSVITQQEHPILSRPYFVIHPCHTPDLLAAFKTNSKNIIVTFLSLITPLLRLNLPLEYGL